MSDCGKGYHWAIILAGGEGKRMRPLTMRRGELRPKQYCSFRGDRTMLEVSLDRASRVVSPERILTVIGSGHSRYLTEIGLHKIPGRVIEQPVSRGTAAGIFLPLAFVMAADPHGVVVIFPSDHFVAPQEQFLEYVICAGVCAEILENSIVLLGANAESPESDYGWIQPGDSVRDVPFNKGMRHIRRFHEKPPRKLAKSFFARGFLWNTMVMAAKAATLWQMGLDHLPEMMSRFEALRSALEHTQGEAELQGHIERILAELYQQMPTADFCRDLIQRSSGRTRVIPLNRVTWSDWGRPERVIETLEQLGEPMSLPRCAAGNLKSGRPPESELIACNCYLTLDSENETDSVCHCAKGA